MPIEKHDLIHELPEHKALIHTLKKTYRYFANQF